jgi:probable O-glycosylation ligase (exosortase A-associated)
MPISSATHLEPHSSVKAREPRGVAYLSLLLFLFFMCAAIQKALPELEAFKPTQVVAIAGLVSGLLGKIARGERFTHCAPTYLIFAFITITGLSVPGAIWPGYAFQTFIDALKIVAIFLLISNVVKTPRKLNGVAWAMCIGGLAPAAGSIKHYFSGVGLVDGFRSNWVGVYSNPNDLAYAMAMLVPLALALTFSSKRAMAKLIALACIGFYILAIFFTFSRMGFLCLVIIMVMTLLRSQQRTRNFVVLIMLLLPCLFFVPAKYWQRAETITQFNNDRSSIGRLDAWRAGLEMVEAHPLLGVGANCYQLGWNEKDRYGETRSAHNTFFQALGELGVPGLTIFSSFLFVSWRLLWRIKQDLALHKKSLMADQFNARFGNLTPIVTALDIGFWVFIVCSITGGQLFSWYPYIFSAMAISARQIYLQQEEKALEANEETQRAKEEKIKASRRPRI